jgi:two-component system, cell cycle sensor histidine kinase and response regulator CckA
MGRSREEIIGRKCFELVHETEVPIAACPCNQVTQTLNPATDVVERGDRSYELLAWPILGSDRRMEGFVHIVKDITERKRVEQKLRENEARFRAVFEVASVGVVQVDPSDGRISRYNEKYREITGYTDTELRAMRFRELTHPDDRERDWELFSRAVRGETPDYRNEKRYVRKDGSIVWVRLNASFVRDGAGKPQRTVAICEDITERKQAEVALRESEERYRMLFENSLDAVLLTVPDGGVLSANPAACRMFGRTEAEICTLGRGVILDPKDPRLVALLAARTRDGKAFGELDFFMKDGSSFPGEVSSVLFEDRSGSVRSSMIIRDVTERKLAESALRQSEGKFRTIFESSASAMAIIERDKTISMVNREFSKLSRYEENDVIGQSWLTLIPPEDLGRLQEYNSRRLVDPSSAPDQYEFTFYRKDGAVRNCLMSVGVIPTSNQIICSFVDITERKRAEAKRIELEEQLRGAQKMEAIGRLAGGVAHDFNNLLAVIISYAEFAIDQLRESDPVKADLMEIHKAGHRAAVLTRQLLAFGRKQMLAPEVLSLNGVVTDIESMLTRLLGEDVDVATYLAGDLGNVTADRGQIEQVIMNLAVNSRDAMPEGGKLTIETSNVELDESYAERHVAVVPGRYVLLSVSDTGCGMDVETQSRVFEPFFTTKERGKGTGLGLSTAYGIVKQSGGNIWVYSEPGQGTAFKVYLPRVSAPAVEAARTPVSEAPTGSETVLVVEDEDAVRRLTERILRTAGYRVLAASNGGEALLLCEKHGDAIDLLLTDVVMPQMGGRDLSERLAKLSPGLRVLFTSGYTDEAIVHHGALDHGTNFIGKPFSAAALTRKVREVLDEPSPSPSKEADR